MNVRFESEKSTVDESGKADTFLGPVKNGALLFQVGAPIKRPRTKQEEAMSIPRGTEDGSLFLSFSTVSKIDEISCVDGVSAKRDPS